MAGALRQAGVGGGDGNLRLAGALGADRAVEMGVGIARPQRREPRPQDERLAMAAGGAEQVGKCADDLDRFALDGQDAAQRIGGGIDLASTLRDQRVEAKRLAVMVDMAAERGDCRPRLHRAPRLVEHLRPLQLADQLRLIDHRRRPGRLPRISC